MVLYSLILKKEKDIFEMSVDGFMQCTMGGSEFNACNNKHYQMPLEINGVVPGLTLIMCVRSSQKWLYIEQVNAGMYTTWCRVLCLAV